MTASHFAYGGVEHPRDIDAFGDLLAECFPQSFTDRGREEWPWFENPDHFRLLRRGDELAAGLVALPVGQWFGARAVPMWAIRLVGVGLTFRSLGAAHEVMAAMLREAHAAGVALSSLYPATQPLYRSVGYEQAGFNQLLSMPAQAARVRDRELELQRFDPASDRTALEGLYRARARVTSGHVERVEWFWKRILQPRTLPDVRTFVASGDNGPEGYVSYAMPANGPGLHGYDLTATDFVAGTARAARRLLGHIGEHHSMGRTVRWRGTADAPAFFALPQQSIHVEHSILWMLRIVDVQKALVARGFAPQVRGELAFEVHDELLPDNGGRWMLTVEDGRAQVERGGKGDLKVDIRGLAPLYAGHLTAHELTVTGLVAGSDATLQTATHLFSGPRCWMPDFF